MTLNTRKNSYSSSSNVSTSMSCPWVSNSIEYQWTSQTWSPSTRHSLQECVRNHYTSIRWVIPTLHASWRNDESSSRSSTEKSKGSISWCQTMVRRLLVDVSMVVTPSSAHSHSTDQARTHSEQAYFTQGYGLELLPSTQMCISWSVMVWTTGPCHPMASFCMMVKANSTYLSWRVETS